MSYIHNSIKENQEFLRRYEELLKSQKLKNLTEKEQGDGK